MGHNPPKPPPGFQPMNVADAHWLGQPVIIYCLDCAESRKASSWNVFQRRGNLPFGIIQDGFWCRGCGRSAVVVVLPVHLPTPRDWTRARGVRAPSDEEQRRILMKAENLPYRIDRWSMDGHIDKVMVKAADLELGRACFEIVKARYPGAAQLTLREGLATYGIASHVRQDAIEKLAPSE